MARALSEIVKQCSRLPRGSMSPTLVLASTQRPSWRRPRRTPSIAATPGWGATGGPGGPGGWGFKEGHRLPCPYRIADGLTGAEEALLGRLEDPACGVAVDVAGAARIRLGLPRKDPPAPGVAAVGLP